jgi:3-hydroxyisobutyrate dehydrogenase
MSGGAAGAAAGTLTLMIGGDADALARAQPFLNCIAGRLFHLGAVGAGHTMKLLHNMICHTIFFATAEGCLAAERAGLDLKSVVDVLNASNARSYISEVRFPKHILSGAFDGRSRVFNLAKDLQMAVDLTAEIDQPAVFGPLTSKLLQAALARGLAEEDFTRLYNRFEELVGTAFPERKQPASATDCKRS